MEEIKIGEYIKTPYHKIEKVERIDKAEDERFEDIIITDKNAWGKNWLLNRKTKHSPNIIDLIEVGDYVNGIRVINILDKDEEKIPTSIKCVNNCFYEKEIKSIITREQFASVEYKIGGENERN